MKKFLFRYKFAIILCIVLLATIFLKPEMGEKIVGNLKLNVLEMLSIIPPVFILLGLLDAWIEREIMMKYMGDNSGLTGSVIAFIMGSVAAGPLYAAFPVAAVLLRKGVKLFNIFLFIGAWSTTKVPMLLFETSNLGIRYMVTRLICNIIGIIIIAYLINRTTNEEDRNKIYENAKKL